MALTAVSLLTSMVFAEVLTRTFLPRPGFESTSDQLSIIPHPTRGYVYSPNRPGINSWGLRDDPIGPGETVHILAVGDSLTVGGGVRKEEAWPEQLQLLVNSSSVLPYRIRVVNAGVSAYSLRQIRVLTEELAQEFKPRIIVVGLYSSRYWRINDPYVYFHGMAVRKSDIPKIRLVKDGMIHTSFERRSLRSLDFFLAEHFYFGAHILRESSSVVEQAGSYFDKEPSHPDIEKLLEPLLTELEKIHYLCAASNAHLVVLLINEQEKDGHFKDIEKQYNEVVKSFGRRFGVAVVDPLPVFEETSNGKPIFRLEDDHHWSSLAHEAAAKELMKFLMSENLLTGFSKPSHESNSPAK